MTSVIAHDDDNSITNLMTDDLVVLKAAKVNKYVNKYVVYSLYRLWNILTSTIDKTIICNFILFADSFTII